MLIQNNFAKTMESIERIALHLDLISYFLIFAIDKYIFVRRS